MHKQQRMQQQEALLKLVTPLECVLRRQLELHRQLLPWFEKKQDAIRRAAMDEITRCCEQENILLQQLTTLEKERLTLLGALTAQVNANASGPVSLPEIAVLLGAEHSKRLLDLGGELRCAHQQARSASAVIRSAAEALSTHMRGLMQMIFAAFSRAGVYGQRGTVESGGQLQYALDVKS